jgi:hypothetical protein
LYVPPSDAARIEAVRRAVDPVQSQLIPAHVTLCREDEIAGIGPAALASRMAERPPAPVTLTFGEPERFDTHGILLPCVAGIDGFDALRAFVLGHTPVRRQSPHLTLAHPRNPKVVANELGSAASLRGGITLSFDTINLIEQVDDEPWVIRATYSLRGSAHVP